MRNRFRVLAFDVFGTVVDWHGGIVREVTALGLAVDADAFALAWRAGVSAAGVGAWVHSFPGGDGRLRACS